MPTNPTNVLAVVIGRAGSKGVPGKNNRLLAGQPIVRHTLDHAMHARSVDRIVVSTDCSQLARVAEDAGIFVVDRPPALATDDATVDSAVRHAVEATGASHEVIVILYANVPVRPHDLIDRAVEKLVTTGADSVQSYHPVGKCHPCWMMRIDDDARVTPYEESTIYRRQDLPPLLLPDGGVIAVTRQSLFTVVEGSPHAFLGDDRRAIHTTIGEVIDIDDPIDVAVSETLLAKRACGTAA